MQFNDREKAFENKFSMDQESLFRIEARTSRLVGLWAAEKMGLTEADAETYAKEVIASNLDEPGYGDIKRKVSRDMESRGIAISSDELNLVIEKSIVEATKQIEAAKK